MPTNTDRPLVVERRQIGVESVAGTAVPATKYLQLSSLELNVDAEIDVYGPEGQKYDAAAIVNKEWTAGELGGKPSYSELTYWLAMLFGQPTTTTPGGGVNTRQHSWSPSSTALDTPVTLTVEQGQRGGVQAERATSVFLHELELTFSRNGGNEQRGGVMGQRLTMDVALSTNEVQTITVTGAPTGGNFTITYDGQTTAAIAHNANAAAVQSALEALSNIAVGDVVVTGGPGPGTPWVVEFRGNLAQTNVPSMTTTDSFTGGSLPASAVAVTTAGSAPTAIELAPIAPGQVSVYLDDTAAGLGTTKLLRDFVVRWRVGEKYEAIFPLNAALSSFADFAEGKPVPEVTLTLGNDSVGRALLTTMRAGASKFMRIEAVGDTIEGSLTYRARFDCCLKVVQAPDRGEQNKLSTLDWTLRLMHDATWGKAHAYELRNTLTGL